MTPINVTFDALGQTFRVEGHFSPSRPAIVSGPADNWEPPDPAEWYEYEITLDDGSDDLTELLERVRVPGQGCSALDHVLDMAELQWLRDREADRWAT